MTHNMRHSESTELADRVAHLEAHLADLTAEVRELTHTLACVSILTSTQLDRKHARGLVTDLVPDADAASH